MRLFTDLALINADNRALELYRKIATLTPTETFTMNDIEAVMFYLSDYRDEIKREQRRRHMGVHE